VGEIVPSVVLPPAIPFTSHVTVASATRQNEARNVCVCARSTVADGGEIELDAEQVTVTLALADFAGSATLVAVTLTVEGEGGTAGAT